MRSIGSAAELQRRRLLAMRRLDEGFSIREVADFLEVSFSAVWRWRRAATQAGLDGLRARPAPGRPPKLARWQEKVVLRWLDDSPTAFGFDTELWTAARVAALIQADWGIELNHRYVCRWLAARGLSPQRPQRVQIGRAHV